MENRNQLYHVARAVEELTAYRNETKQLLKTFRILQTQQNIDRIIRTFEQ